MKNQETGEFELVLGNRQLLSGFFIIVILFSVFFVMGYIVGRNSAPSLRAAGEVSPGPAPGRTEAAQPPEALPPAAASETAPGTPPPEAGNPPPASEPAGQAPPPASPPEAAAAPARPEENLKNLPDGLIEPAPGETYLQVSAVKPPEAEVLKKILREKGFRAVLAAAPDTPSCTGCVRVLVGPFTDKPALGQAKAGLENAGFRAFVRN